MSAHDISINDLHAAVTPRLADFQKPADVHFSREGSQFLAEKVVAAIRLQLAK